MMTFEFVEGGEGVAMAVPIDEQKSRRAGSWKGDEREKLMRFCKEASWGVNEWMGRAKFTSHAQWMICVVSDRRFSRIGA